ncbi:MAG: non-ribosomal peptide synthetase, partial [Chloroflexi bacterium]
MLAARYPVLTATYTLQHGEPIQQNLTGKTLPLEEVDAPYESLDSLKLLLQEEANKPIDLTTGPILRVKLYHCRNAQQGKRDGHDVLGFIVHHIAVDFSALELLVEELFLFYHLPASMISGGWLREPGFQHADYVRWQQAMLHSKAGEWHWQYWQNTLSGDLPVLDLPTDRPRPPMQ